MIGYCNGILLSIMRPGRIMRLSHCKYNDFWHFITKNPASILRPGRIIERSILKVIYLLTIRCMEHVLGLTGHINERQNKY